MWIKLRLAQGESLSSASTIDVVMDQDKWNYWLKKSGNKLKRAYSLNRTSISWDPAHLLQYKLEKQSDCSPRSPQHLNLESSSFPHHLSFSRFKFLYKVPTEKRIHLYKPRNQPSRKQHRNSKSHHASSTSRCPRIGILPHSDTISINPTFRPINTRLPNSFLTRRWVAVLQTAVIERRDWDTSAATML
jgi:hypothetical protein